MNPPLLILDLDETILHSTIAPLGREADFRIGEYHTYLRPHLPAFLRALRHDWMLGVWTAATPAYAETAIHHIRQATGHPLHLAVRFDRLRCTPRRNPETQDTYWLKDLKKITRHGYPLERILVIDDKPESLTRHRGNLLRAPEWTGDPNDTFLLELIPTLGRLREQENFRTTPKARPTPSARRAPQALQ